MSENAASNARLGREFGFSQQDFDFISSLAYQKTGIVLAKQKKDMVYGRLTRRLRALGLDSFGEYCDLLQTDNGRDEMSNLVNAITTNLTHFFREEHHFEHLNKEVLQPHVRSKAPRLRIWSAACSSGMEPYSIAMTLSAAYGNNPPPDAKILATDIDSNMLEVAQKGEYAKGELQRVPAAYKQYVNTESVEERLKNLITFRQLNLLGEWPVKGPFDAIFCRNVMIYFDKDTKAKLVERFAKMLKPGGWLYIGHSENLAGLSNDFELKGRTIYRRLP